MVLAKKVSGLRSTAGFPDLVVYEPRGKYAALFLELKAEDAKVYRVDGTLLKDEHLQRQYGVLQALEIRGFCARFAVGFDKARRLIDWYLKMK